MAALLDPSWPIRTERLLLRPYELDDLAAILDLFGREDVSRYLNWPAMDEAAATALLQRRVGQSRIEREGEGIAAVVVEQDGGRVVGEVVLSLKSLESRQGETGWTIHPDTQGRGYATEAAWEMLRLGFEELGLHRIVAECDPRNVASIRVMERLGMRPEANHRDAMWLKGEWIGSWVAAMLESEWPAGTTTPKRCRSSSGSVDSHDSRRPGRAHPRPPGRRPHDTGPGTAAVR